MALALLYKSVVACGQLERACTLLREALAEEPLPVAEVTARMSRQEISRLTLFRARQEASIVSDTDKTPEGSRIIRRLPPPPQADAKSIAFELLKPTISISSCNAIERCRASAKAWHWHLALGESAIPPTSPNRCIPHPECEKSPFFAASTPESR